MRMRIGILCSVLAAAGFAAVADRVAVIVGDAVITESEVREEVKVTQFLNGEPLNLGPEQRRAAAERLVDQHLIRRELELSGYTLPPEKDAERELAEFRKERFPSDQQFRAALERYGITEETLKRRLRWQRAAIEFTEMRFQPDAPEPPALQNGRGEAARSTSEGAAQPQTVDEEMEAWLRETRASARIRFNQEAFQ
jgi:hypothetical protein